MGSLAPHFVSGGGVLYTMIVPGGGFLPPSSRVPRGGGGVVLDEIDSCITELTYVQSNFHRTV